MDRGGDITDHGFGQLVGCPLQALEAAGPASGLQGVPDISLTELPGEEVPEEEAVAERVAECLGQVLGYEMIAKAAAARGGLGNGCRRIEANSSSLPQRFPGVSHDHRRET